MRKHFFTILALTVLMNFTVLAQKSKSAKPFNYFGDYSVSWGSVEIRRTRKINAINFSVAVSHNNGRGCGGDFSGEAKKMNNNVFEYAEKVKDEFNYSKNTYYYLRFTFSKNRVAVKETVKGDSSAVNQYHGGNCTFNGTYIKK